MPSVIPSPEVRWLSECHCRCLWDDPACFHPSQPPMAARWKARGEWSFKHSITATFEGCQERKNPQRRRFMFYVFFCRRKETRRGEDLLQNRLVCVDAGIGGLLPPLPDHASSYPLCCLMTFRHNVQAGVDGVNENVSQPCVWCRPPRASIGWEETGRRYGPMLYYAVSDWWLSVAVLWLGCWWFITTTHNVIRLLCVYTLSKPVVAVWSLYLCVFLHRPTCRLSSYYRSSVIGILLVAKSG